MEHKYKFEQEKQSNMIGYAPAYMKIQHVNNPAYHRESKRKEIPYDAINGIYKANWENKLVF